MSQITLHYLDDSSDKTREFTVSLRGNQAEWLPHIVDAFKDFLCGAGFDYVESVIAVKTGGEEVVSYEDSLRDLSV